MKANWINVKNAVIGVVYRYFTTDGKSYVGCTTDEQKRKNVWNCKTAPYGGAKIAAKRQELGLDAFQYERLDIIIGDSKDMVIKQLERLEAEFIEKFDSIKNGYNSSMGGRGNKGIKMSEEVKAKIRQKSKKTPVRLIPDDGGPERVLESMTEVSRQLHTNIGNVSYYLNIAKTKSINGYKLKAA